MINLIDQHGEFNQRIYQFPNAQATIAIFGSQSSGKSTLLNAAFGTYFPTLDSLKERKRCTKGMWLMNNGKFNIIDTQGFDSVQRSSEMRIYERQVALLCLAVADVIIVNIWMNQIGRYEGGQLHILKSIIKASNSIIKSQTKTILFVVKDCTRDADTDILKDQLENSVKNIIQQNNTSKKTLKFNLEYYFMSHYIHQPHEYETQAKKLSSTIKVKTSCLAQYNQKDRLIYIRHLWQTIVENDGQIDLRLQEEALRSFIVKRIRKDVQRKIEQEFKTQTKMGKRTTYERFYEYYIKKSFDQIRKNLPKYVDDKTIKNQYFLLQQQLGYEIQKHFTFVILPNEEEYLLRQVLDKELRKSYQSIQLEKIIHQKRKQVLQHYKLLVQGHKQASILAKRFSERVTQTSVLYQRQVSHLFNIFQSKLESEINKQLDRQVKMLKFDHQKLSQKVVETCKKFQYNEWELNLREIYQKASHRILTIKLFQKIDSLSSKLEYSMFSDSQQPEIIAFHQRLSSQCENFCSDLMDYFEQSESKGQYIERAKQKVRESLDKCLKRDRKRFKLTLIILGVFLIFFYGEFLYLLKMGKFKKKSRRYVRYFYMILVTAILIGGFIKRRAQMSRIYSRP